jgi:uncharacterized UPF0160 family protein
VAKYGIVFAMSQKTVVTHDGRFHPDEIFAIATLQIHFGVDTLMIIRSREESIIESADIVVDVGRVYDPTTMRFDHHQNNAPVHEDTIPYAAFGLVWKHYGELVCGSASAAEIITKELVEPIDAGDNAVTLYKLNYRNVPPAELFMVIDSYRPVWGSNESTDDGFFKALTFAREYLLRHIAHANAEVKMLALAEVVYNESEQKGIILFPVPMKKRLFFTHQDVHVVVSPRDEMHTAWQAVALQNDPHDFTTRVTFLLEWRGLEDEELAKVSGITDAVFCHKGGFLFITKSKEGAIEAAKQVV